MVKPFRDQLLARAALADDEHGTVERRRTARPLDRVEEREALPDELFSPLQSSFSNKNLTDCWWQIPPFGKDFRSANRSKNSKFPEIFGFRNSGMTLVWFRTGLGP